MNVHQFFVYLYQQLGIGQEKPNRQIQKKQNLSAPQEILWTSLGLLRKGLREQFGLRGNAIIRTKHLQYIGTEFPRIMMRLEHDALEADRRWDYSRMEDAFDLWEEVWTDLMKEDYFATMASS